jgi:hypothetical protein
VTNWADFEPVDPATPKTGRVDWSQFEPIKKDDSDFGRGFKEAFQQVPQLGYGLLAGAGAAAEKVAGEGGIATGIKKAGVEGYQRWGDKIAANAKESDSWSNAYEQAKQGDFGGLVDWLQHGLGYVTGQGVQMLATAGIGAVGGKFVAGTAARQIAEGLVAKEAAEITAASGGKVAGQQALEQATARVAEKFATIGQNVAMGAAGVGQEGGEIFGDLVSDAEKEGRTLSGADLGKAFAATLAAGGLEFVGDKLGLDIVLGRSRVLKPAETMTGFKGRMARGAIGAAAAAPVEGATEFGQTLLEEAGKGHNPIAAEALAQARDAAALGMLGGTTIGGAGGALHGAKVAPVAAPAPAPAPGLLGYQPDPLISFPDGTVGRQREVDDYLAKLPEAQRADARARLMGLAPQKTDPVADILAAPDLDTAVESALKAVGYKPTIPVGEATEIEVPPIGEATEIPIGDLPRGVRFDVPRGPDELPPAPLPVGEVAPLIPTGEATELPRSLPVGRTEEVGAQQVQPALAPGVQPGDLLTKDGMPYGSRVAAAVRARKEDGVVVDVPGGWVVRPRANVETLPVGETAEALPTGEATELEHIPTGEAAEAIPAADATEVEDIPAGEATELDAEQAEPAPSIEGAPIDKEWSAFTPESGTKGIPRAEMPQIKAEHRGALVNFLGARGITHESEVEIPADQLKPTQTEFSPAKVQKAREYEGGDRSILVSSDGHVLDGHHQWLAKREAGEPVKAIVLDAPITRLLSEVREVPSVEQSDGATNAGAPAEKAASAPVAPPVQAASAPAISGNPEMREPAEAPAAARKQAEPKAATQAPPEPATPKPVELIALRKRLSVLKKLKDCLG